MKPTKEFYLETLMSKPEATSETYLGVQIIRYVSGSEFSTAFFKKRAVRPSNHFRFQTVTHREKFIEREKQDLKAQEDRMQAYKTESDKIQKGSILFSDWGYDQTNIDWYKVIDRKKDFCTLQQIGSKKNPSDCYQDRGDCLPDETVLKGTPFKKFVNNYGSIKIESYINARLWDGKPKSWSSYA